MANGAELAASEAGAKGPADPGAKGPADPGAKGLLAATPFVAGLPLPFAWSPDAAIGANGAFWPQSADCIEPNGLLVPLAAGAGAAPNGLAAVLEVVGAKEANGFVLGVPAAAANGLSLMVAWLRAHNLNAPPTERASQTAVKLRGVCCCAAAKVNSRDDWMIKCSRDSKSQPGARIWARASVPTLVTDVEHDLDDELPGVSAPGPCQREASGDISRRAAESMGDQRGHV